MASSIRSRRRRWRAHEMLLLRRTHASRRVPPSRVAVVADGVASSSRLRFVSTEHIRRFLQVSFNLQFSQRCRHPFSRASLSLHRRRRRVRRKQRLGLVVFPSSGGHHRSSHQCRRRFFFFFIFIIIIQKTKKPLPFCVLVVYVVVFPARAFTKTAQCACVTNSQCLSLLSAS